MKVSREVLKSLIKECVIEVFQESFGATLPKQRLENKTNPIVKKHPQPTQIVHSVINEVAAGDPVMAAMFADTANTTLAKNPEEPSPVEKFSGTPEQVFGTKMVTNWAALAFAPSPNPGAGVALMQK